MNWPNLYLDIKKLFSRHFSNYLHKLYKNCVFMISDILSHYLITHGFEVLCPGMFGQVFRTVHCIVRSIRFLPWVHQYLVRKNTDQVLCGVLWRIQPLMKNYYCGFCLSGHYSKSRFVRLEVPRFVRLDLFCSKSPLEGAKEL